MSLAIRVTRDDITPDLRHKLSVAKNPAKILRAIGTQLVSLTKRAFRDTALRQSSWAPKSDGGASNLIQTGMLVSSIRVTSLSASSVTIGSDRKYAAIHQLGGVIRPKGGGSLVFTIGGRTIHAKKVTMPARPFFPFTPSGELAPVAVPKVMAICDKALAIEMRADHT